MPENDTQITGRMPWRQMIPVERLIPNPDNPRGDPGDIEEMEMSIRTTGLKQPLLVVPAYDVGGEDDENEYFYIEDGWCRYEAMKDWCTEIQCIIRPLQPGENIHERFLSTALVTDIRKKTLNPIERAKAYGRLRKEFGLNQVQIGKMVGLSTSTITNSLSLLELSADTQRRVARGSIKLDDAMRLIRKERAKNRRRNGGSGHAGAVWEPDWFAHTHPLAGKAVALCNRREHNSRRRIGARRNGGFPGACGQCWESVIRNDQDLVMQAVAAEAAAGTEGSPT